MATPSCILIVEDSISLAMTFKAHLDGFGHTLLMAADGKAAYAMLRDHKVDCILLDLNLPDMEGMDLLEDVRGGPAPPSVVVISSNTSLATAERAVCGGAFDYLLKPFSEGRLVTTVENAIVVCGGNLQLAARKLGISPSTIYRKKEGWQQAG